MSTKRWLMWLVPGVASWRLINVLVRRRKSTRIYKKLMYEPHAMTRIPPPLFSRKKRPIQRRSNFVETTDNQEWLEPEEETK